MEYVLGGSAIVLCCAVWLWHLYYRIVEKSLTLTTLSDSERKFVFICDVCDGNRQKAEELLSEKRAIDETLSYEQALDLVYVDMLDLTADERGDTGSKSKAV